MSLCPVCGRVYCDHTPEERGQTDDETMRDLTPEVEKASRDEPSDSRVKIGVARKHQHAQLGRDASATLQKNGSVALGSVIISLEQLNAVAAQHFPDIPKNELYVWTGVGPSPQTFIGKDPT